jgi:transglutaminase-like putative cysteine protease
MRRSAIALAGLLLLLGPVRPDQPQGKIVEDIWDAAYLEGGRAGYVHTVVREFDVNGRKLFQTISSLNLSVKRFQQVIQLKMDSGTTETADGKVTGTFMRQYLGQGKQLEVTGKVVGNQIRLTLDRTTDLKPAPWNDQAIGMYRQLRLLAERKVKPGDEFDFLSFEPTINLLLKYHVLVKDPEEVDVAGGKKHRLLRVEMRPPRLEKVQLPTLLYWVDDSYQVRRSQVEAPGLGTVTLYRTTRESALGPATVANLTDIGIGQYVRLKKYIARPYQSTAAVYRITIRGEENAGDTFSPSERQEVKNIRGNSLELHVRASRGPKEAETAADKMPGHEFIDSSYFINSDDPRVQQLARQAVGNETDPWRKALRIESWVHNHMKVVSDEAMATADHVARTLRGDCSEFAMLTAAMCRAAGIPSRTAIGLIYAKVAQGPVFAFHMWTEVWVRGQWIPIDATLGQGYVGATHLKITDHSWNDTRTMTPLLPLLRVIGKLKIEVVSVGY